MRDLYLIFEKLSEMKIGYCLQSHHRQEFFNLMVYDRTGKQIYIHAETLIEIEKGLKIVWGHLLKNTGTIIQPSLPKPMMPLPPRG